MKKSSQASTVFHSMIESDAEELQYGTTSYTVYVNKEGDPVLSTLKVTKTRRRKYANQ
jgi:hypothetical protein